MPDRSSPLVSAWGSVSSLLADIAFCRYLYHGSIMLTYAGCQSPLAQNLERCQAMRGTPLCRWVPCQPCRRRWSVGIGRGFDLVVIQHRSHGFLALLVPVSEDCPRAPTGQPAPRTPAREQDPQTDNCAKRLRSIYIEHKTAHSPSHAGEMDPFGAHPLAMPLLFFTWGRGTYELADKPEIGPKENNGFKVRVFVLTRTGATFEDRSGSGSG